MDTLTATETPFIAKTRELCETLLTQDHFKSLRASIEAFLGDEAAQEQYRKLDEQHADLSHRQQMGGELSEEEVAAFNQAREDLLGNPICDNFINARRSFQELQQTVQTFLDMTLDTGAVPTADEVEEEMKPKGGCCGGGGCGGGSCG